MQQLEAQALVDRVLGFGYTLREHPRGWSVTAPCRPGRPALGSVATWVVCADEEALIGFPPFVSVVAIREQWGLVRRSGWVQARCVPAAVPA